MKKIIGTIVAFSCLSVFAAKVVTPRSVDGVTVVTAKEAKALQDKGGIIVDVRKRMQYETKRIKGAVNVAYKEKSAKKPDYDASKDKWKFEKIAAHKGNVVIFYCNGVNCWKSYKAAVMASKNGFAKVHWLRTGFPAWEGAGFPTE